jgi:hypothetical protein
MQAIQQMQRPAVQMPQNPIFGGQVPIPMDFGLPEASRIPAGFRAPAAQYTPGPFNPAPAAPTGDPMVQLLTGGMFGEMFGGGNQN